jgi:spore germination protein KB
MDILIYESILSSGGFSMNKNADTITISQTVLLMMASVGLINHVLIIPVLLQTAKRDAWISVLFTFGLSLLWCVLVYYITKTINQQNILLWVKSHFGKPLYFIFVTFICIYLFALGQFTFIDTVDWTIITFLPIASKAVVASLLAIVCLLTAATNLRTIVILNGILLPFIIFLGFVVSSGNFQHKNYKLLTPFLENGFQPVLHGMIYSGAGLAEFFILWILIQHHIKTEVRLYHLWIIATILMGLTIGPLIGAIAIFGPDEAARQRFPAYEEWRMLSLGRYFEHLDFFAIYQWMSGTYIRLALFAYFILESLNVKKGKRRILILGLIFTFAMIIILLPFSDMEYLQFLRNILLPYLLIFVLVITFFLAVLAFIYQRKKKGGRKK